MPNDIQSAGAELSTSGQMIHRSSLVDCALLTCADSLDEGWPPGRAGFVSGQIGPTRQRQCFRVHSIASDALLASRANSNNPRWWKVRHSVLSSGIMMVVTPLSTVKLIGQDSATATRVSVQSAGRAGWARPAGTS